MENGTVDSAAEGLPAHEERHEDDGLVYVITKTKRGREVKTLKSVWLQQLAKNAKNAKNSKKRKADVTDTKDSYDGFNSELCSVCKENDCAAALIDAIERDDGPTSPSDGTDPKSGDAMRSTSPTMVTDCTTPPVGPSPSDLLMCDGPCLRSFHIGCLQKEEDDHEGLVGTGTWLCDDCENQSYECGVCHNFGQVASGELVKCSRDDCGRFYHPKCLELLLQEQVEHRHTSSLLSSFETRAGECPAHTCVTCGKHETLKTANSTSISARLFICGHCPTAYHRKCIPPWCEENESYVNCPRHAGQHLPRPHIKDLPRETLAAANKRRRMEEKSRAREAKRQERARLAEEKRLKRLQIEEERALGRALAEEKLLRREAEAAELARLEEERRKRQLRFPMLVKVLPRNSPRFGCRQDRGHFRLHTNIITEVDSKPHPFQSIRRNDYSLRPRPAMEMQDAGKCTCSPEHGCRIGKCSNGQMFMECVSYGKSSKIDTNCKLDDVDCGNRRLQKRQWAKSKAFNTHTHGWGLRAAEDIAPHTLIMEYNGEAITEKMAEERLQQQKENGDRHVYMMQLSNDCILDARHKGNLSRLINHSCDPNCSLQRWCVGKEMRIGIFAIKKITDGTELTYDYQLSANEEFKCLCGTKKCRGTLRAVVGEATKEAMVFQRKKEEKLEGLRAKHLKDGWVKRKDLKQLEKENEKRAKRLKAAQEKAAKQRLVRLNLTSRYLPGSTSHEVKDGPKISQLMSIMADIDNMSPPELLDEDKVSTRAFLFRNVVAGSDMLARYELSLKSRLEKYGDAGRQGWAAAGAKRVQRTASRLRAVLRSRGLLTS